MFYYRPVHYTAGLDPMPQDDCHSEVARFLEVWGTEFL